MEIPVKGLTKKIASAFTHITGLELIPSWRLDALAFESFLRRLFEKYSIDVVVDVGANLGQYRDFIRYQVGYQGLIVSFEPDPECLKVLRERSKQDKNWLVEPYALGRQNSELELRVAADSRFNSFLGPDRAGLTTKLFKGKSETDHTEMVEVRILNDYINKFIELGVKRPYLKLDTQGFDLEVMGGADIFLENVCALQTEVSVRPIYDGMPGYREMFEFLSVIGFNLSQSFSVSHDPALRLIEFDCIAINSKFADILG